MELRQSYLAEEVESSPGYRVMPGVGRAARAAHRRGPPGRPDHRQHRARGAHEARPRRDLNRYFAFGGYGSDANERVDVCRKALDRAAVAADGSSTAPGSIATGDTPLDVEAGHGAGIRVVGVATGEYSVEQLTEAGGDWVVASLADGPLPF